MSKGKQHRGKQSGIVVPDAVKRQREKETAEEAQAKEEKPPVVFEVCLREKGKEDSLHVIGECHGVQAIMLTQVAPGKANYQVFANISPEERTRIALFLLGQEMIPMSVSGMEQALFLRGKQREEALKHAPVVVQGGGKKVLEGLSESAPQKRRRR